MKHRELIQNKRIKKSFRGELVMLFAFIFLVASVPVISFAAINKQINYQGKLTTPSNTAVVDDKYNISFSLYNASSGGSPIWTEKFCVTPDGGVTCGSGVDQRISVTSGLFSVMIGSLKSLVGVDFNQTLYLGVTVSGTSTTPTGEAEMTPRKIIGSVPSAFVAETLDGLASSSFMRSDAANATSSVSTYFSVTQNGAGKIAEFFGASSNSVLSILSTGMVGIGSTTPYSRLSVIGNAYIGGNLTATGTIAALGTATSSVAGTFEVGSSGLQILNSGLITWKGDGDRTIKLPDGVAGVSAGGSSLTIKAGKGTSADGMNWVNGGNVTIEGGDGHGGSTAGNVVIKGGATLNNMQSGAVYISTQDGSPSGEIKINTGNADSGGGTAGDITISTGGDGTGNLGSGRVSGNLNLSTGNGYTVGTISLISGNGVGSGGNINLTAGNNAGDDYADINYTGGSLNLTAGDALFAVTQGTQYGGNITLNPGQGNDFDGNIILASLRGKVGIGTTSPSQLLTVGSNNQFTVTSTGNTSISGTLGVTGTTTLGTTIFSGITGSTQCLHVDSNGKITGTGSDCGAGPAGSSAWTIGSGFIYNSTTTDLVGIGSSTPYSTLSVTGNSTINPMTVASSSGSVFFTILSSGNVGVGTAVPSARLHVAGLGTSDYLQVDTGINLTTVTKPTALTANLLAVAGNVDAGNHRYIVTYVTGLGETEIGAYSNTITADAGHGQVSLTNIPVSTDYRVTKRKIYRTIASSALYHYKLLTTINDNTTTTYTDNTSDANLTGGASYPGYYYQDNTTSKFFQLNGSTVFYAGLMNTFAGKDSGAALVSPSTGNTFFGNSSGKAVSSGVNNSFFGYFAGSANLTNGNNSFFGYMAGGKSVGANNTFSGSYAGYTVTSGSYNTALGAYTLSHSDYSTAYTGNHNIAIGMYSGWGAMTSGAMNTFVGNYTGQAQTSGQNSLFLGYTAGKYETQGSRLIIDTLDRTNEANQRSKALMYGVFDTDPLKQILTVNAKLGVGTTSPASTLTVWGANTTAGVRLLELANSASTTLMYVDNAGNVGMPVATATTTIGGGLSVGGVLNVTGTTTLGVTVLGGITGGTKCLHVDTNGLISGTAGDCGSSSSQWTTNSSDIYYNTGMVGVGTTSPIAQLSITGNTATSSYSLYVEGSSAVANKVGSSIVLNTGAGSPTGSTAGGDISIKGGIGGTTTTGTGGVGGGFTFIGGAGGVANNNGGTGGAGGAFNVTAGSGANGTVNTLGGVGGAISITAGTGGTDNAANGTGGALTLTSGTGGAGAGTMAAGSAGGALTIQSGGGGTTVSAGTGGSGGLISILGGAGASASGSGAAGGNGGGITLTAGNAGAGQLADGTGGTAGAITITAGNGANAFGPTAGGNVVINGGVKGGSSTDGNILLASLRGKVAIGTGAPGSQILTVTGSAQFSNIGSGALANDIGITSDGTLTTNTSDERLKENIAPLSSSTLDRVLQLNPITFTWKNDASSTPNVGFLAQEVKLLFPETVFQNMTDGYYGINYSRFPAILTKAIQELNSKIEALGGSGVAFSAATFNIGTSTYAISDYVTNTSLLSSTLEWVGQRIIAVSAFFKEITTDKVTVNKGIEMKDQDTGEMYCIVLKSGNFVKTQGNCSETGQENNDVTIVEVPEPETGTSTTSATSSADISDSSTTDENASSTDNGGGSNGSNGSESSSTSDSTSVDETSGSSTQEEMSSNETEASQPATQPATQPTDEPMVDSGGTNVGGEAAPTEAASATN